MQCGTCSFWFRTKISPGDHFAQGMYEAGTHLLFFQSGFDQSYFLGVLCVCLPHGPHGLEIVANSVVGCMINVANADQRKAQVREIK